MDTSWTRVNKSQIARDTVSNTHHPPPQLQQQALAGNIMVCFYTNWLQPTFSNWAKEKFLTENRYDLCFKFKIDSFDLHSKLDNYFKKLSVYIFVDNFDQKSLC